MLTIMRGIAREKRRKERSLRNTINPAGEVTWWLKHLPPKCGPEFMSPSPADAHLMWKPRSNSSPGRAEKASWLAPPWSNREKLAQ